MAIEYNQLLRFIIVRSIIVVNNATKEAIAYGNDYFKKNLI